MVSEACAVCLPRFRIRPQAEVVFGRRRRRRRALGPAAPSRTDMLLNGMAHRCNAGIIAADRQAPKPAGAIVVLGDCPVLVWKFQSTRLVKIAAIVRCVGKRVATRDGDIANGRLSTHISASHVANKALVSIFASNYAAACPRTDLVVVLVVGRDVLPQCRACKRFCHASIC